MISCIVSSRDPILLTQLKDNIKSTIGVPHEIISLTDPSGKKGICKAYNIGGAKAKFPYLCFVHEDVLFETQNWGQNACSHFSNDPSLGLIGVAGCKVKSEIITTWYRSGKYESRYNRYNYRQCLNIDSSESVLKNLNPLNETISRVVCLDGVFLCARREAFEVNKFDESMLKYFHGYDLDFSIGVSQKFKVAVVYDILLKHYSEGNLNKIWVREAFKVHKKWKNYLPAFTETITDPEEQRNE